MDYRETTISGTSWRRAFRVEITNPLGQPASISYFEQDIATVGVNQFMTIAPERLSAEFDLNNQLHVDIYTKLNELYVLLREARDLEETL
jgi:hypothetical protein